MITDNIIRFTASCTRARALALLAALAAPIAASAGPTQITSYSGQQIATPTGTLLFTWPGFVSLAAYQEAGLQVSCHSTDEGQGCSKCCRPWGFSAGGYFFGGAVQELVTITRADGGALSALEFQAGDYYNGCLGGDGTIYLWALVSSGGNVTSFDINAPSGAYVGFSGVFDKVQVGAYSNSYSRDLHQQTQPQAIAMDNMRYVSSDCPAFAAPASIETCSDGANSFSVAAIGAGTLTYQWQWQAPGSADWLNVVEGSNSAAAPFAFSATGSQAATLTRTGTLTPGSVVQYRCVVSNACSSITSSPATLAVRAAPLITEQPQDQPMCGAPGYAFFSAIATTTDSDPGPFTYQWQKLGQRGAWSAVTNSENITGATTAYLTISFDATDAGGQFRCIVSNPCSSTTSGSATLSFGNSPVINSQPVDTTICGSGTGVFDVGTAGTQQPYVQWSVESPPGSGQYLPIADAATFVDSATGLSFYASGALSTEISISSVQLVQHPSTISLVAAVSNSCGTVNSSPANLTVCVADFDCSGAVTVQDIFSFLTAWFAKDPSADINGDGAVSVQDIFAYLGVWFAGCH